MKKYLSPNVEMIDFNLNQDVACDSGSGADCDFDDHKKPGKGHHWPSCW